MKFLKPFGTQNFVLGIGIAAATYLLGPTIKRNARKAAVKGMQGTLAASGAASSAMEEGRERMSGMFKDRNGGHGASDQMKMLFDEIKEEKQQLNELAGIVNDLQEEISTIKEQEGREH